MQIMNATEEDKDELLALYHAMIGGPCEWSETYPDENTIAFDLKNEDLFVMKNDAGEIIATISIDHDDAVESLTCWHEDQAPSGELSRLCVRKDMQGQGIAKQMMNYAGDVLNKMPMEFAVEAQKLLQISLEGCVEEQGHERNPYFGSGRPCGSTLDICKDRV